jgi:hypothetical protein
LLLLGRPTLLFLVLLILWVVDRGCTELH